MFHFTRLEASGSLQCLEFHRLQRCKILHSCVLGSHLEQYIFLGRRLWLFDVWKLYLFPLMRLGREVLVAVWVILLMFRVHCIGSKVRRWVHEAVAPCCRSMDLGT